MKNANEPCCSNQQIGYDEHDQPREFVAYGGLTKREYFAGLAMTGVISNNLFNALHGQPDKWDKETVAKWSIEMADAILKELEIRKPQ